MVFKSEPKIHAEPPKDSQNRWKKLPKKIRGNKNIIVFKMEKSALNWNGIVKIICKMALQTNENTLAAHFSFSLPLSLSMFSIVIIWYAYKSKSISTTVNWQNKRHSHTRTAYADRHSRQIDKYTQTAKESERDHSPWSKKCISKRANKRTFAHT